MMPAAVGARLDAAEAALSRAIEELDTGALTAGKGPTRSAIHGLATDARNLRRRAGHLVAVVRSMAAEPADGPEVA